MGFIGFYWVLPGFTGFYWVFEGVLGALVLLEHRFFYVFSRDGPSTEFLLGFQWVVPGFTGFYWVLPDFAAGKGAGGFRSFGTSNICLLIACWTEYRVFTGFLTGFFISFNGCYWVLPGLAVQKGAGGF